MIDKFAATRKAIAEYDRHQATYEDFMAQIMKLNNVDSQKLADDWFGEEARLKLAVGVAFVDATSDINSSDKAHFVDVEWAKSQTGYTPNAGRSIDEQRADYIRQEMGRCQLEGWPMTEEKAAEKFNRMRGIEENESC